MPAKKNFTIKELEKLYNEHKTETDALGKQLEEMKKEEADRKKAELALQKEERHKEIEAVSKHLNELCKAYIEDYGHLTIETKSDDYDWFPSFWRRNFWF